VVANIAATSATRQPVRLVIPSLDIDAAIEGVGQDSNGLMAAPLLINTVAWYNLGPRPGENGNAVIAGHFDDVRGRPAVFWDLDELEAGDEIIVRFDDESELRFAVMGTERYQAGDAPLERIFGVDFERDLNLITCDGDWNAQQRLYSERLVVYARLIREAAPLYNGAAPANVATNYLARASALLTDPARTTPETDFEAVDEPTETTAPPSITTPTTARASDAWQNRHQPLASR
jgi:LPXTG-site transpeptidase (sortase) family protein